MATYLVGPGDDFENIDAVNQASLSPGDVVDGQGATFYERLVPQSGSAGGGYITYQNFTLDATASVDGSYSYAGGYYSNISPWTQVGGTEIWYKAAAHSAFMFEDGVALTPIVCTSSADAEANIARGQFTFAADNNRLYYRATDGAAPATHALRVNARCGAYYSGSNNMIVAVDDTYVTFTCEFNWYTPLSLSVGSDITFYLFTNDNNNATFTVDSLFLNTYPDPSYVRCLKTGSKGVAVDETKTGIISNSIESLAWDSGNGGVICLQGKSYVKFIGVDWKNNRVTYAAGCVLETCDHISFDDCHGSNTGGTALNINTCTNIDVKSNCSMTYSWSDGIGMQGDCSDITLRGTYNNNGRVLAYYDYTQIGYGPVLGLDGDNIGIGGAGGTISNVTVEDAVITDSGPPDGNTSTNGSGLYVGTNVPMTVSNIIVRRVYFGGNHVYDLILDHDIVSGSVTDCIFNGHAIIPGWGASGRSIEFNLTNAAFSSLTFDNNTIANCESADANMFINNQISTSGTFKMRNNIFFNTGTGTMANAVVYFYDGTPTYWPKVTESNNLYYDSGVGYGDKKIAKGASTYTLTQIDDGTWYTDSGQGTGDIVDDPLFVNAGGSYGLDTDFQLDGNSPCISAGTSNTGVTTDYIGQTRKPTPDIGAWEYYLHYTRGSYVSLPADDTDLTTAYTTSEYANVLTDDGSYTDQSGSGYVIHEFKQAVIHNIVNLTWNGQSNKACSDSTVYLQIYNRDTETWDQVDYDDSTLANTDFTLAGIVSPLDNYKDVNGIISCRVYQG